MSKQGPLDIQTVFFEDYLEVWVCSTRNIQKMDLNKSILISNLQTGYLYHYAFVMLVGVTVLITMIGLKDQLSTWLDFSGPKNIVSSILSASTQIFSYLFVVIILSGIDKQPSL